MTHTYKINTDLPLREHVVEAESYAIEDGYFHFQLDGTYGKETVFSIAAAQVVTVRRDS